MFELVTEVFVRGNPATVRGTGRHVQVHRVVTGADGSVRYDCRSLDGCRADDRRFFPKELGKLVRVVPVLPAE